MRVALDTSGLMMPVELDVRLFDELERLLEDYTAIVPEAVVEELRELSAGGGGIEGTAASVGHDLAVERCQRVDTDASYADDALVELAATIDDPEPTETTDAADTTDGTGSADATAPHDESVLRRQRADFEAVAESTDVDFVPYDDAATFLASDLYTVPPANTRFQWVDDDALAAD